MHSLRNVKVVVEFNRLIKNLTSVDFIPQRVILSEPILELENETSVSLKEKYKKKIKESIGLDVNITTIFVFQEDVVLGQSEDVFIVSSQK